MCMNRVYGVRKLCMSIMNRSKTKIYIYRDFQEKRREVYICRVFGGE